MTENTHEMSAQTLFKSLEQRCDDLVGLKLFTCSLVDMEAGEAKRVYTNDAEAYPLSGTKRVEPNRWTKLVLDQRKPFLAGTIEELRDVFPDHEKIEALGLGATINLPIPLSGSLLGTVNILDTNGCYHADSLVALEAVHELAVRAFNAHIATLG